MNRYITGKVDISGRLHKNHGWLKTDKSLGQKIILVARLVRGSEKIAQDYSLW